MENTTKKGFLEDGLGDKSSKRLTGFILLSCAIAIGLFAAILGSFIVIATPQVLLSVFGGFLSGALVMFGLTVPEAITAITKKE
jgi:hypothetical protein